MSSSNRIKHAIVPAQCRGARGLLNWTRDKLAEASGVPARTIADLELGNTAPRVATTERIAAALEAAGVEFIERNGGGPGVRLRNPDLAQDQGEGDESSPAPSPGQRGRRSTEAQAAVLA